MWIFDANTLGPDPDALADWGYWYPWLEVMA